MSSRTHHHLTSLRFGAVASLVTMVSIIAGCSERGEVPRRRTNLLLVTIDTLRADHCSSYGYSLPTTPHLDGLAREGFRFETAYAPMPVTGPTHATLLTSIEPFSHGVVSNGRVLPPRVITLAEALGDHGYRTAAMVSSYPLKQRFGFSQGFEHFDEEFPFASASIPLPRWEGEALGEPYDRRADETTRRAISWLEAQQESSPFFLWVHYFDPHSPYDPPEPYRSRFKPAGAEPGEMEKVGADYDGEIAFTDHEIGRLVEALDASGMGTDTLIIVTSDHGEGLSQHGEMEHGRLVYEEAVRVPLIFRWPGNLPAKSVWPGPVKLADVVPTVCELLGVSRVPVGSQGRSLAPILRGRVEVDDEGEIFFQSEYNPSQKEHAGVRRGRWKYVVQRGGRGTPSAELFDLERDPWELTSVADQYPDIRRELARSLRQWRRRQPPPGEPELSEEDARALKALGYAR